MPAVLLFDGDCGFCRLWVERYRAVAGERVTFRTLQSVGSDYPGIRTEAFEQAVHFIDANGRTFAGAAAAFRLLYEIGGFSRWTWWAYLRVPGVAPFSERAYRLVADNRTCFSTLTRWLWGASLATPTYDVSSGLFLRALSLVYFIAFLSLMVQLPGLYGSSGILPIHDLVGTLRQCDISWLRMPSLFLLASTDAGLNAACAAGIALAAVGLVRPGSSVLFLALWGLYLSFTTVGGNFLAFQWDVLLLEAGFLAIFATPPARPLPALHPGEPSRLISWLYRWLLFRLMFASGVVKLTSGDATWRNLEALAYHFQTQPIPNLPAWFAHQLPHAVLVFACGVMFAIELGAPLFIFAPRRLRLIAGLLLTLLQVLIAAAGNFTFFNLLSLFLCLWLVDDHVWRRIGLSTPAPSPGERRWPTGLLAALACTIVLLSAVQMTRATFRLHVWPRAPVVWVEEALAPFRIVNAYGLFSVMTTQRPEIVIEGSRDGEDWRAYEFRYKPGDLHRPPPQVAPHQPRLDWQMWFAALGDARSNPWFMAFCGRLLEGSQPVLSLLAHNPFPDTPPRYLRARRFDYTFTTSAERDATGNWWKRTFRDDFLPVVESRRRATQ